MSGFRKKSAKLEARSKMCWNKKTYASEAEGEEAADRFLIQFKSAQKPYLCPNCNLYHLTTAHPAKVKA